MSFLIKDVDPAFQGAGAKAYPYLIAFSFYIQDWYDVV